MKVYEVRTPDTDDKWVLVCDEVEMAIVRASIQKVLEQPPHNEHDCDADEHACTVLYMSHDLLEAK